MIDRQQEVPTVIHLVVAVDAEAKPVISWFGLKRLVPDRGFPVFRHQHVALVVSGPGKANSAAATAHLHAVTGYPRDALWINLGVCGHEDAETGSAFVINAIDDRSGGRSWYPPQPVTPPWPGNRLSTLDRPDNEYRHGTLVDMEASGFYATACRFSTSELVQVVKIVSDNESEPADRLKPLDLSRLVGQQLDALDLFLHRLGRLANQLEEEELDLTETMEIFTRRCRFTERQRQMLKEELRRWSLHSPHTAPPELAEENTAARIIEAMAGLNDRQPLVLS
jgi:hypothetical protein